MVGGSAGLVLGAGAGFGGGVLVGRPVRPGAQAAAATAEPDDRAHAKVSYAQNGEDLILWQTLVDVLHVEKPDYIDVGAWDPIQGNNTYMFYRAGGRGVLVEPNPVFCAKLRAVRKGDVVVAAGIGVTDDKEADYYIVEGDGQLNTFSKEQVEQLKKEKQVITQVVKMPMLSINDVLAQNFKTAPALFSIDTEGMDLTILRTLNFDRWRPKVFIVESMLEGARLNEDIVAFMVSKDYKFRGGNIVNTVFVDHHVLG